MTNSKILKSLIISLLSIAAIKAYAQKLPATQKESVLAPANIKIDGKADEWNNQFKAYNTSTDVFYTMSNDANNLYLVVQATKSRIVERIINGGITLTIKNSGGDKVAPVAVTYPLIAKPNWNKIIRPALDTSIKMPDTLRGLNKNLAAASQDIGVSGFIDITDSLISVYNEHGIKTGQQFNTAGALTYELAIPLKYIVPLANAAGELKYNIKLNGIAAKNIGANVNGQPVSINDPRIQDMMSQMPASALNAFYAMTAPTDFSGTYKLAK